MGLSEKAIEEAATAASEGITEQSTDSEIEAKANQTTTFLKITQGEATRWAQTAKQKAEEEAKKKGPDSEEAKKQAEAEAKKKEAEEAAKNEPAWFTAYKKEQAEKLTALETENKTFKAEKSKGDRQTQIKETAAKFKIPEWMMKRISVPEDADINQFFTDIKQDLVTQNLMPVDATESASSKEKATNDFAANLLEQVEVKEK
jgi:membrane protein involved in colicin uptake